MPSRAVRPAWATAALVATALLGAAAPTAAQEWSVEAFAGAAIGNYSETSAGLDVIPGPVLGLTIDAPWRSFVSPYASFSWVSFGCEESFCIDRDVTIRSWGPGLGLRWRHAPVWLRTGVVYHGLSVATVDGTESVDPGIGLEAQGGARIGLTGQLSLMPQVGYLRHATESAAGRGHVAAVSAALGFRYRLGPDVPGSMGLATPAPRAP